MQHLDYETPNNGPRTNVVGVVIASVVNAVTLIVGFLLLVVVISSLHTMFRGGWTCPCVFLVGFQTCCCAVAAQRIRALRFLAIGSWIVALLDLVLDAAT